MEGQAQLGSSPLARGTQNNRLSILLISGLIPARAGNTLLKKTPRGPPGAHPRSRGEHRPAISIWIPFRGSSPLARGTRKTAFKELSLIGLIPARAGNTRELQRRCAGARAHPRSRGEHIENPKARLPSPGSSPLARGTRKEALEVIQLTGLIPARAGNTQSPEQQFRSLRAHPRSRGEHQLLRRADSPSLGSSPLARGTRRSWHQPSH